MPGYDDRASILQGAGDMIFQLVLERSTPQQWAKWLRVPLEHAAGTANYDLVQKLLKAGANGKASRKGGHGETLLHAAAEGGDGQVVTALIRAGSGADKNVTTALHRRTPLHVAILGGKEAAAKALIMAKADPNIHDDICADPPLHLAITGGHAGLAQDLLISGALPNVKDLSGDFPIHLAARRGQAETVLSLIQRDAKLNLLNKEGHTPLAVAMLNNRFSAVKTLLTWGADVNIQVRTEDGGDGTVLHIAAESNKAVLIPALVEAGADIEARGFHGETPLTCAARTEGSGASLLALLQLGAEVNTESDDGTTPLHEACRLGDPDAADLLLRWGADESISNNREKWPENLIPSIASAPVQDRPSLERLTRLLQYGEEDRAWRRRGFLVMCRAHPDRLRLAVQIPDSSDEGVGRPQQRPSRRSRREQVKVEVQVGGVHGAEGREGAGSSNVRSTDGTAGGEGYVGGFDRVAAWLMAVKDQGVFRNIVEFL
eukprot:g8721.t1